MRKLDIFDETALGRMCHVSKAKAWTLSDIDWNRSVDYTKFLLPLNKDNLFFPDASEEQKLAISQLMGLIVASTIAQHEQVANELKLPAWEKPLRKHPINPEFMELGENFFEEEAKHSYVFNRYIDKFATGLGIESAELRQILPSTKNSALAHVYKMNSYAGGAALWWLVAALEEESVLFYKMISASQSPIDPLYKQIHRLHFEEEVRHKSFAPMMIDFYKQFHCTTKKQVLHKVDFILAEVLNITWTFSQLIKLKDIRELKKKAPFFDVLSTTMDMLYRKNPHQLLKEIFTSTPYISSNLQLSNHEQISSMIEHYDPLKLPIPLLKADHRICI